MNNTRFQCLLEQYLEDRTYESYEKVIGELYLENAYYYIINYDSNVEREKGWFQVKGDAKFQIGTWSVDNLIATAVFSSLEELEKYLKQNPETSKTYVCLGSKYFFEYCETMNIERIVLNNSLDSMLVMGK